MNTVPDHDIHLRTVLLGSAWAMALMLLGLTLWLGARADPTASLNLLNALARVGVCGAHFIFFVLVVDNLIPDAPPAFRLACQGLTGLLTWMALIHAALLAAGSLEQTL